MQLECVYTGVHSLAVRALVIPGEVRLEVMPSAADAFETDDTLVHSRAGGVRIEDAVGVVACNEGLDGTRGWVSRFKTWKDTRRR